VEREVLVRKTRSWIISTVLLLFIFPLGVAEAAVNPAAPAVKTESAVIDPATGKKKDPIDCFGDHIEYDELNGTIYAKGNVRLLYKDITLTCDEIRLSTKSEDLEASGHILLIENSGKIKGDSIKYNLKKKLGFVNNVEYDKEPWFFKGKRIERPDPKNANMEESIATTCNDHEHPHYKLVSGRIHLLVDEKIECWDTVVYLGDIPIFYFPYYYKDFKNGSSPLSLRPGYSSYEGAFLKIAYNYELTNDLTGSLLLDLMSVKGIGYGFKQNYNLVGLNGGGSLYSYYINEADTLNSRWNVNFEHHSDIVKDLNVVARLDYFSDQAVLNDLYSSYYPVMASYINSYIAFTKTDPSYTGTLALQRQDNWDSSAFEYKMTSATAPSFKFQSNQLSLGSAGFYGALNGELTRYYVPSSMTLAAVSTSITGVTNVATTLVTNNDFFNTKFTLNPSLLYSFQYYPGNTLSTSLAFSGSWLELSDPGADNQGLTASVSESMTLHNTFNQYVTTDLTHSFSQRLRTTAVDINGGTDLNKLTGRLGFAAQGFSLSFTTGYDLRRNIDQAAINTLEPTPLGNGLLNDLIKARIDPLTAQLGLKLSESSDASINTQYRLYDDRLLFGDIAFGFNRGQVFTYGLGGSYAAQFDYANYVYQSLFDISANAAFNATQDLRLDLTLKYDTVNRNVKEVRGKFTVNLTDCIAMDFSYMQSLSVHSLGLNIYLRAFSKTELDKTAPEVFKY